MFRYLELRIPNNNAGYDYWCFILYELGFRVLPQSDVKLVCDLCRVTVLCIIDAYLGVLNCNVILICRVAAECGLEIYLLYFSLSVPLP